MTLDAWNVVCEGQYLGQVRARFALSAYCRACAVFVLMPWWRLRVRRSRVQFREVGG